LRNYVKEFTLIWRELLYEYIGEGVGCFLRCRTLLLPTYKEEKRREKGLVAKEIRKDN
jgi:hypothetical protein